jgi:LmbE family N-acetylglucosaminyl deacetylase
MQGQNPPTQLITDFSPRQVLVLAPHMDDEVLGCGGIVRQHILSGAEVTVVYMTDGRKGNPHLYNQGLPKAALAAQELALVSRRKDEAARAAKILGVQEQIYLDFPDTQLELAAEAVTRVQTIVQERRPMVVYLPSILDLHPDHWATNCVLYEATQALRFCRDWCPVYRGYEVWTPLLANRLVDISDVIMTKEEAMRQFESQLAHTDFVRTILGLNTYRSLYHAQGHGYVEAFYESAPDLYCLLFQHLAAGSSDFWGAARRQDTA